MLCYDHMTARTEAAAVALCSGCGAGICAAHANECASTTVISNAVGAPTVRPDGRTLHCTTCHRAAPCGR